MYISGNAAFVIILSTLLIFSTDINECVTANGGCDHTCTDTIGSYYCTCDNGYTLQSDKHKCVGM